MGVVGHDLRTPLSAIMIGADLMARRGGIAPEQERTLSRIHQSAYRATHIIHDLLEYSRRRAGGPLPIHKQPIRVADACERAVLEHRTVRRDVEVSLCQQGDTALEADAARISQVASNLIGNAIQHGQGRPVDVLVDGKPDEVVLCVHNRGPPIAPEVLPRIFEPFQRDASDVAGARAGSVGLGLYIVREIVSAHQGWVEVESTAERGTTFTVRLPRGAPAAASAGAGEE
jgi:signal transduction histidine kinase